MSFGSFEWRHNGAIDQAVDALLANTSADSEISRKFRARLQAIIEADNTWKLDKSIDKDGVAMKPLAASTKRDKRRPPGGPLGTAKSRFRTQFRARWDTNSGNRWILTARYEGLSFAVYHMTGARKPGKWRLPKRDLTGLTPRGRGLVAEALAEYRAEIAKSLRFGSRARAAFNSIFRR